MDWGWVSEQARHAIHLPFEWDGSRDAARDWDEPTLYSLMEYFHDAAQRPRSPGYVHHFAGCGPHYAEHNSESGALVYRWRANALLDRYGVGMRLGKAGASVAAWLFASAATSIAAQMSVLRTVPMTLRTRSRLQFERSVSAGQRQRKSGPPWPCSPENSSIDVNTSR